MLWKKTEIGEKVKEQHISCSASHVDFEVLTDEYDKPQGESTW
jgi:hypothetical protein